MTASRSSLFDEYSRKARLYPASLTAAPVVLAGAILWPASPLAALWPLIVSLGAPFFIATWVRGRGQTVEARLVVDWNGMPTTHLLRYAEMTGEHAFERRRAKLAAAVDIVLPTADEEARDPTEADHTYVAATRALIARVRARKSDFPLVQDENTQFGFRRNMYSMKPVALTLLAACVVLDVVVLLVVSHDLLALLVVGVHLLVLSAWLVVVKSTWVRQQGDTYANRLFETLEDPRLTE